MGGMLVHLRCNGTMGNRYPMILSLGLRLSLNLSQVSQAYGQSLSQFP